MLYWLSFYCMILYISVLVKTVSSDLEDNYSDYCEKINCVGEEYTCVDKRCYCAPGYIPIHFQIRCVKCPGLGEKCFGQCCSDEVNDTLQCIQGICQPCHNAYGNWICRDSLKDIFLISSAQVAMGAALVLGIIATFILLYKICATATLRPLGGLPNEPRLSVGSLQLYIDERLRDAPPRYTRATVPDSSTYPPIVYLNNGFVHDSSIPPPPYVPPEDKTQNQNTTIHI